MALQRRRHRKQTERQNRLDLRIIANAPAQVPNYRRATEPDEKCTLCRFNTRDNFCSLFSFDFIVGFTCDRFEPREESILEAMVDAKDLVVKMPARKSYEVILTKSQTSYRASINAASRGLWSGNLSVFNFIDAMNSAINRGYEQAWREGARTCGIQPSERTPAETRALNRLVTIARTAVLDFGEWIESKQDDPFSLIRSRIDVWANRYGEVKSTGSMMACADQKEIWELGIAEKHCKTCNKLNGRVMRNSRWAELDVVVQDTRPGKLDCNGFRCTCTRTPTDKRATPGRLPSLP